MWNYLFGYNDEKKEVEPFEGQVKLRNELLKEIKIFSDETVKNFTVETDDLPLEPPKLERQTGEYKSAWQSLPNLLPSKPIDIPKQKKTKKSKKPRRTDFPEAFK